ncbi:MAG: UDP-N-acetylglucosamine 1-carboxyvinyltransferase [Ruminococcaceae bacterium]|nr:UDP-N-acetylglucosamine 1-carboxyvinyltransferase [Oscillospiraceae bacterium]
MDKIVINGGNPLYGDIEVSGAKNAAVAVIYACLLVKEKVVLENIPPILDVSVSLEVLRSMGAKVKMLKKDVVEIDATEAVQGSSPAELVRRMRASYYLIGAELGRYKSASVGYPGGCDFGVRPIDQHIKAFTALGADVEVDNGRIEVTAENGVNGANVFFDVVTVGGTMNLMIAAACAKGTTVIENAAREPHVVDLANFLNTCGANIKGAGTDTIKIKGVEELHGCTYAIIPDMIEAGTYMIAAAATGGKLKITNIIPKHLESMTAKLKEMGVAVSEGDDYVMVSATPELKRINIKTLPYPGFPTDMQPQMCVLLCLANGVSLLNEGVWDNRFRYVEELKRMGANIKVDGKTAIVEGVPKLSPAKVRAVDLRAGAAMIIAGLATSGKTEIEDIHFIERGYDNVVGKLAAVGASIKKVYIPDEVSYEKAN